MRKRTSADRARTSRPLLQQVLTLLEAHRPAFRQERVFRRAVALTLGQYLCLGRHTITQSLVALGLVDDD